MLSLSMLGSLRHPQRAPFPGIPLHPPPSHIREAVERSVWLAFKDKQRWPQLGMQVSMGNWAKRLQPLAVHTTCSKSGNALAVPVWAH